GVPEDPATGSASGPLGVYLVRQGLVRVPTEGDVRIVSEQGTKMGRQSFIHIRLQIQDRVVRELWIGGSTVPVLDGVLRLPRPAE
ncbi:MAG: PhzF family phenazine biosynthesis protein, partial [Dehalococcoidia bacterium]